MAEAVNMILPMLKEIRVEITDFREAVTERLSNIEKAQRSFRIETSKNTVLVSKNSKKQVRAFEGDHD